jgi:nicotinate-nucleotide adenylyltransferase
MDIGVLGGTFDPVHNGHLIIAEDARVKLGLGRVLFVPAGEPWLKGHMNIASGAHRLEMVRLATAVNSHFIVSTVDLDRAGPSYTEDTLDDLRRDLGEGVNLYFIVGVDALAEFPTWRHPERIVQMCYLVAVKRPESLDVNVEPLERSVPGIANRIISLDNPLIDISSTNIRLRIAAGLPITNLVPPAVEQYIVEHALYVVT